MSFIHRPFWVIAPLAVIAGCVTPVVNETGTSQPAIVSVVDDRGENYGVQPIVLTIDGRKPRGSGVAIPVDGSGSSDRNYEAGTVLASPPLLPAAWDFAVAPGTREIGLIFAVPGRELFNWAVVTRGKGSEATGVSIDVQPGCQYEIATKLTLVGGRDYEPIVRYVRPIPTQMGLPAAASCPQARDVQIRLIYN
jgi:hypothetical protein